jgi:Replication initiation factor.
MSAQPLRLDFVESGIDYITCTETGKGKNGKLMIPAERIMRAEARQGNEIRGWRMEGYSGFRCGQIEVGERHDGSIVRMSGSCANENWKKVFSVATNCSRLDLQATYRPSIDVEKFIRRNLRAMLKWSNADAKRACVDFKFNNRKGTTLYSGVRSSAEYLRMYDKFMESHLEWYRGCVRLEAELKARLAQSIALQLFRSRSPQPSIVAGVRQCFSDRGAVCLGRSESLLEFTVRRRRSDRDRYLTWLKEAVRPGVQKIVAAGDIDEVLLALDLAHLRQTKPTRLRRVS